MATGDWYIVPAGTPAVKCRGTGCGKMIYFITHPRTKRPHPIDCSVDKAVPPSPPVDPEDLFTSKVRPTDGSGVSHFDTCPAAAQFRRYQ